MRETKNNQRKKPGGKNNLGWGNQLVYAGRMALRAHIGERFATYGAHCARWAIFCSFLKEIGIRDVAEITNDTLVEYAKVLSGKVSTARMKISYAVNLLSTVNVVMSYLRGDRSVRISPRKYIGTRSIARTKPPTGFDIAQVDAAATAMRELGRPREALVIQLARRIGARLKEACLLDTQGALAGIMVEKDLTITRGTKGNRGKYLPRKVEVTASDLDILRRAAELQGVHSNLIPPDLSLKQFMSSVERIYANVRDDFGLGEIKDLRAAKACEIYEEATGYPAPVVAGGVALASKHIHLGGLDKVGEAMGHDRRHTSIAYVGRAR